MIWPLLVWCALIGVWGVFAAGQAWRSARQLWLARRAGIDRRDMTYPRGYAIGQLLHTLAAASFFAYGLLAYTRSNRALIILSALAAAAFEAVNTVLGSSVHEELGRPTP